ncbi:MAG: class I SAM-dependent methyltransferase [Aphanocapsa lilacina HA4352-LM1]|jgi:O-methyltransferase involved in polyketide biosynthesis|nr:class I SAM-dependent methyltransferase [Aphanocapsa lilacina HA4352-LM1]
MAKPGRALLLAELTAGARAASRFRSPEAVLLSRGWSRLAAGWTLRFGATALVDQFAVREAVFFALGCDILRGKPTSLVVDIGSGFSALGLRWARTFPDCSVLELDLPAVAQSKRRRVESLGKPDNWHAAGFNLSTGCLEDALSGKRACLLSLQGVLPYFSAEDIGRLADNWRDRSLAAQGVLLCDLLDAGYFDNQGKSLSRSPFRSRFADAAAAARVFTQAGFEPVESTALEILGRPLGWRNPGNNGLFICKAFA